jgi:HPt (histidine-containing phosphotransfer) domain-containing protein
VGGSTVAGGVPPAVLVELHRAFVQEVCTRLPHFASPDDVETARRDAHTLASSAWVVGEPDIARLAREVENTFPGGPVDELVAALRRVAEAAGA